jgi:rhodanese-related sulfurtransferase
MTNITRSMKRLIIPAAAALLAVSVYAAQYPEITIPELKSAISAKSVVLLDANGTDKWSKGHIPGAVDFTAAKDNLTSVLPKDKKALVVAYCGGPKCRAYEAAAKAAQKLGYTNVKHLTAGISGWQDAGEKMEPGS